MISKKFFLSVAACGLLALFSLKTSRALDEYDAYSDDAFYLKAYYNPFLVHSTKEFNGATPEYKPKYKTNFMSGGGGLGYYFSGVRVELEGLASGKVEVDGDAAKAFTVEGVEYKNDGFKHITGLVSGYYDIMLSDFFAPYIGAGFGASYGTVSLSSKWGSDAASQDSSKDLNALHFAGQLKAGISLPISKSFVPYAGYKFHWMMEKEYDTGIAATEKSATGNKKLKISHMIHNIEAGVMVRMG